MSTSEIRPMEQFEIRRLFPVEVMGVDLSFTTSSMWMLVVCALVLAFLAVPVQRDGQLVPNRLQSMREVLYEFVVKMVADNAGPRARCYFPYVFSLFVFILFSNLLGIIPYTFTLTSHLIVTFTLALISFLLIVTAGFAHHGLGFLKHFVPSGVPAFLLPLVVVIELISYLTRPFSLAVRLFANMLAGHTMLAVFASFVYALGVWLGWLPVVFILGLDALEILVALLQAYVFSILVCIYLGEAVKAGH